MPVEDDATAASRRQQIMGLEMKNLVCMTVAAAVLLSSTGLAQADGYENRQQDHRFEHRPEYRGGERRMAERRYEQSEGRNDWRRGGWEQGSGEYLPPVYAAPAYAEPVYGGYPVVERDDGGANVAGAVVAGAIATGILATILLNHR
jgi:Ni/Co efflux regulator RcnB